MSLIHLSPSQLRRAADLKEKIEALQSELLSLQGGDAEITVEVAGKKGGSRKFSAAGLERIREAQKRRWAKLKGNGKSAGTKAAGSRPRKMTAAGIQRIREAQKRRWAKANADKAAK